MEFQLSSVIFIEDLPVYINPTDRFLAPHKCTPTTAAVVDRAPNSLISLILHSVEVIY